MVIRNRVIWKEGLFIKPQHFQQQQRYVEYLIDELRNTVGHYFYGISELVLNDEYLSFGRIAIDKAVGIMPDGSVFRIPQEDVLPEALEIEDASLANQTIYLALPLRSDSLLEINWPEETGTGRYESRRSEIRDVQTVDGDVAEIDVSPVRMKIMLEKEDKSAYSAIAIAKILEKRPDGGVVLDPDFIPCNINVNCYAKLHRAIVEIAGLMQERAKSISERLSSPNQSGVADVSDFMLLQALNRLQPQMQHLSSLTYLHPERLFECLASICGELATFTSESRTAPKLAVYNHDMPTLSFTPLIRGLRQSLSVVLEPRAVAIALEKRKYGLMVALIQDTNLLDEAEFIIAVKARMQLDELRRLFVQQTKVSSVEKIRDLISLQLPGIPLIPLPVAPRQLPYHAGYTYYQLDKSTPAWEMIRNASGFAFHIAAAFDDLDLQFWGVRNE